MTAFAALADALRDLANVIRPLSPAAFTRREFSSCGTVGAHVRHCLDHAWALERGIAIGEVCYDRRERDTLVERDKDLALSRLTRASVRLGGISDRLLDRPLTLVTQTHADGRAIRVATTAGRELAFVISHTIHHCALVAVLLEHAQFEVPARFGLAPATPTRHRAEALCAP
jgi:uncharacterized damage-inducible protein DinB